jgi:lipid-binding SYLF domain-containing protein
MRIPRFPSLLAAVAVAASATLSVPAFAQSKAALDRTSKAALNKLVAKVPAAKALNEKAIAVLVFPSITKAGLVIGGQYGEGVLWQGGKAVAYYSTSGASYGLQAGAQKYGYAMFFMREKALSALNTAQGFEVGVGPSVVVMDDGMGKSTTTTNLQDDIYAFIFSQQGLMAGLGIQGNKITKLKK